MIKYRGYPTIYAIIRYKQEVDKLLDFTGYI